MADSPYIREARHDQFENLVVQESDRVPVLVDFWAGWCAPCKMLMPILARLADDYRGKFLLVKVNTDEEQELARRYGIRSLPTVMLFKGGQPVDQFMGVQPEHAIRQFLDRHIPREAEKLRMAARDALDRGEVGKARSLLQRALAAEPENTALAADLARLFIAEERYDDADALLQQLPREAGDNPEVKSAAALLTFARAAQAAPDTARLEAGLRHSPKDPQLRYQLSARKLLAGDYEGALDLLLELLRLDPLAREQAREAMLAAFTVMGDRADVVNRYRVKMFNALH
jgi:putative thioredoxin